MLIFRLCPLWVFALLLLVLPSAVKPAHAAQPCVAQLTIKLLSDTGYSDVEFPGGMTLQPKPNRDWQAENFIRYVQEVSDHFRKRLCDLESSSQAELTFIYRAITFDQDQVTNLVNIDVTPTHNLKLLRSPWASVGRDQTGKAIKGVFLFSRRQFLYDQLQLSDGRVRPPIAPVPFDRSNYRSYIRCFMATLAPCTDAIPEELYWLFARSPHLGKPIWHSNKDGKAYDYRYFESKYLSRFILLNSRLIDRFFDPQSASEIRYENILQVGQLVNLRQLRISEKIFGE
jgi:hypothetical protein